MSILQKQALHNSFTAFEDVRKEEGRLPTPSPGVVRRGSRLGLQRSSSLRQEWETCSRRTRERRSSAPQDEDELEVMRHFVAVDKKVFSRGDTVRRRAGAGRSTRVTPGGGTGSGRIYTVSFLGTSSVGKTSLIEQLSSSEHTNVYQNDDYQTDKER